MNDDTLLLSLGAAAVIIGVATILRLLRRRARRADKELALRERHVDALERGTAEVVSLREEIAGLEARLAALAAENRDLTAERDALRDATARDGEAVQAAHADLRLRLDAVADAMLRLHASERGSSPAPDAPATADDPDAPPTH